MLSGAMSSPANTENTELVNKMIWGYSNHLTLSRVQGKNEVPILFLEIFKMV